MSRKTITEEDGKLATAKISVEFSAETPDCLVEASLNEILANETLDEFRETISLQAIALLDHEAGKEFLATGVKDFEYDTDAECTAIVFADNSLELYTDTVPLNPKHANNTIEELYEKDKEQENK